MVRIYVPQSQARLERLLERLHAEGKVRGLTVIRAAAGLGTRVVLDPDRLAAPDDPPLVLEFFDEARRAEETIERICQLVAARHVVAWPVQVFNGRAEHGGVRLKTG